MSVAISTAFNFKSHGKKLMTGSLKQKLSDNLKKKIIKGFRTNYHSCQKGEPSCFSQTLILLSYHQLLPLCAVIIQHFSSFVYPSSPVLFPFQPHYPAPPTPPNYIPATLQLFLQSVLRRYLILLGCEVILPCYL